MQEPEQVQEPRESDQSPQNDFMIEKIKKRPMNRRKLVRRTVTTVTMAVIFGMVACVTFIVLQPIISKRLYPEKETPPVQVIVFPEDPEEMSPEDMLAENIPTEEEEPEESTESVVLEEQQIQEILSEVVLDKDNYRQIYSALSAYAEELNHSMVTITGIRSDVDWFNNVEQREKQSPGVIIADNGMELLILTDFMPLKDSESMTMALSFVDASTNSLSKYHIPVALKTLDAATGFAVLSAYLEDVPIEVRGEGGLEIASLGSSNTRNIVGMPVIALGSPMGVSKSMGYGMVTAVSNYYQQADINYKLMQTDIFGSQNSSGVLFNLQGQVVGVITTQRPQAEMKNIVCAYGISEMKKRIEKMSNGVSMAYLGIKGMDVTSEVHIKLGVPYGTYIQDMDMNSPIMRAGIQKGDILTKFGEHHVQSYNEYISALMQAEVGSTVEVTVMRATPEEYKEMIFEVTLEER